MCVQLTWLLDDVGIPLDWCAQWAKPILCVGLHQYISSTDMFQVLMATCKPLHIVVMAR